MTESQSSENIVTVNDAPITQNSISQYASQVIDYSSQYSSNSWSAEQTLGEPNTFSYGDRSTAWAPSPANGTTEYLTLGFDTPVYADGITIRETYGNGFVTKIEVLDTSNTYHNVWTGVDTSQPGTPVDFKVDFTQTDYLVKGVRITVDTSHSGSWEEIDAVQLHGNSFYDEADEGNQVESTSWSELFQQLADDGHPLAVLVKETLEQQLANALLPIVVEEITDESLILSYQGSINSQNIVPKLPGIGRFVDKLNLSQHLPTINNPIIKITDYDSNNPSFSIEIPELTTTILQPILNELGLENITSGDTFALSLSAEEVQVTSLSPLSITETVKIVPNQKVKDFVNDLNLPSLNVEEPSIKVISPTTEDSQYHYEVSVSSIPTDEFLTWLQSYIAEQIPQTVKDKFNELATKVEDIDLEIGEDSVKVTYLGNLSVTNLINSLSTELGLGSIQEDLTVLNPSVFIQEKEEGEPKYYEVSLSQIPTGEIAKLLASFTHISILNDLGSLGALDLNISSDQVQLAYGDAIDVVEILDYFGDKIKPFTLPDSFTHKAEEFDLTLVKGSTDFAFSTVFTTVTPIAFLNAFGLNTPDFIDKILGENATFEFEIEKTGEDETISINYIGGVDFGGVIGELSSSLGANNFDTSFKVDNPSIVIEGTEGEYKYTVSGVFISSTPMAFLTAFGLDAPDFIDEIIGDNATFEFEIEQAGDDATLSLNYIGGVDIGAVIGKLASSLDHENFDASFAVNNPSILIETTGNNSEYTLTIPEISPKEAVDLFIQLGTFGTLSTDAINTITSELEAVGNAQLVLSEDELSLEFLEDIEFDLGGMFSFGNKVPLIDSAIDRVVDTFIGGDNGDSTLENTTVRVMKQENETALGLSGALNEQEFDFVVTKDDVVFAYNSAKDLDLAEVAAGIPILEDFTILGLRVIIMNGTEYTIEYDEFGKIKLHEGVHLLGQVDFSKQDDHVSNFIDDELGIEQVNLHLGLKSAGLASLHGKIEGNITVLKLGNFEVTANSLLLGLNVDQKLKPDFQIGGDFTFKGYDPIQSNEPSLSVEGGLKLEPESLGFYINADWTKDTTLGGWNNPFGLQGATIRQLAFQAGGNPASGFDNFGFIWDLKYGQIDLEMGFALDVTDPDNYAFIVTPNQAVSIASLISSSAIPMIAKQIPNFNEGNNVLDKAIDFLGSIFDLEVEAIDSDNDGDLNPLIQYVPFATDIAGEVLPEGFGINGKLSAWGKTATLYLNADTGITGISGGLEIPEIDLEVLTITGANDNDLNLELEVSLSEQYFIGDGSLEILGKNIAQVDFEIGLTEATFKDFQVGLANILTLDVDYLDVSLDDATASGKANVNILDQQLANLEFDLSETSVSVKNVSLGLEDVFEVELPNLTVNTNNTSVYASGEAFFLGQKITSTSIKIDPNKVTVQGGVDLGVLDLSGATFTWNNSQTSATVSGSAKILGQNIANAQISAGTNSLTVKGNLTLGVLEISNATINWNSSNNSGTIRGDVELFGGLSLGSTEISFNQNSLSFSKFVGVDTIFGDIGATITSNISTSNPSFKINFNVLGTPYSQTLSSSNLTNVIEGAVDSVIGWTPEFVQDAVGFAVDTFSTVGSAVFDVLDDIGGEIVNFVEDVWNWLWGKTQTTPTKKIEGTSGDDELTGGNGSKDKIYGFDGDDTLIGLGKDDSLYGGDGDDILEGGRSIDYYNGGSGQDTAYFVYADADDGPDTKTINGQEHFMVVDLRNDGVTDYVYFLAYDKSDGKNDGKYTEGTRDGEKLISIENVIATKYADTIHGGDEGNFLAGRGGPDRIDGWGGNDTIDGGSGNDTLYGDNGDDHVSGGSGSDKIYGRDDDDFLDGGSGSDTIEGGSGNDTIIADDLASDTIYGGNGDDYIKSRAFYDHYYDYYGNKKYASGIDYINGYLGEDTLDLSATTHYNDLQIDLVENTLVAIRYADGGTKSSSVPGIDHVIGGQGDDTIKGDDLEPGNLLMGLEGDDLIHGWGENDTVDGGDGNDTLYGDGGNDIVSGGSGNDKIYGYTGDDTLSGGSGNDYLSGSTGDDIILGDDGHDSLYGGDGDDYLDGGNDNDTLYGNDDDDQLLGGSGNDRLDGGDGNDNLAGGSGNDYLEGGYGDDQLLGGSGNDTLNGHYGDDNFDGGSGYDTADFSYSSSNWTIDLSIEQAKSGSTEEQLISIENIIGGSGNDNIIGNSYNNSLYGGDGDDTLNGNTGLDYLDGGKGNDTADFSYRTNGTYFDLTKQEVGFSGSSDLESIINIENIISGSGDDRLIGDDGNNYLFGGGGNDTLSGGLGDDTINGERGGSSELLDGGEGIDTVDFSYRLENEATFINLNTQEVGFVSSSVVKSILNFENIIAGDGDDILTGNSSKNSLYGGDGDDTLSGGTGIDYFDGGSGNDTADFSYSSSDMDADLVANLVTFSGGSQEQIISIENIIGTSGNNELIGDSYANYLDGGSGDDTLKGGSGNDTLSGGYGNDYFDGGSGSDTADFSYTTTALTINLVDDKVYFEGSSTPETLISIENIIGGSSNDNIIGNSYNNSLYGGYGNDTLSGGYETDYFDGGSGNDTADFSYSSSDMDADLVANLVTFSDGSQEQIISIENIIGTSGDNELIGDSGANYLHGGSGNDTLKGGSGNDTLSGGYGNDTMILSGNQSEYTITLDGDILTITGIDGIDIVTNIEILQFANGTYTVEELTTTNGIVVNGYLAGATVFLDANFNYIQDNNEPVTITNYKGKYSFTLEQILPFDSNNNNQIDPEEGQIMVIGGTDTTTGLASVIPLLSQGLSTSKTNATTPLTTLKTVLNNQGMDADSLLSKIDGLNLTSLETNLDNYDPYTAIAQGDSEAINIISGHIQVMNLLTNGATILNAGNYSGTHNQIQTIIALGNVLENAETFSLSDGENLTQLFTQLDEQLNLNIETNIIDAVADVIAESNQQIEELVENGLNQEGSTLLSSINPIKQALYDNIPALTEQLITEEITPEEASNQVNQLVNSDRYLVEYALSPNHTVSVFAKNNVTEGDDTNGQFTIQLGETAPNQGLTILYTISGTATLGVDYQFSGGSFGEITVNGGENQAIIDINLLDDEIGEIPETITINLKYVGDGFILDPIYNTAILEITDNDEYTSETDQTGINQSGGYGNDTIIGSDKNDLIQGSYGNDVIDSLGSKDFLQGGAGKDTVIAGAGSDRIEGNFGDDSLTGNQGNDYIQGGSGNDVIIGNEGQDQLLGNAGDDVIEGNQGNDVIEGGFGKDLLQGNEDNDWLLGTADNDILIGGAGNDVLNGGSGADVFSFNSPTEGNDLILDFKPEEGDIIQISQSGFGVNNLENFTFFAGKLQFNGETLALIQNNGKTYNSFADLTEIIQLVDSSTLANSLESQVVEESNQYNYSSATVAMVGNPEVTIYDEIIERGYLKVATAVSGAEFDLEFTQAISAAIFGDATKIELINPSFTDGFEMVASGEADISARRITQTSGRDATLNIDFSPVYFYDYQGVLVREDSGIDNALELNNRTIGVIQGSTSVTNLEILLSSNGVEFEPRFYESTTEMFADYDAGNIDALSTDRGLIYGRLDTLSNANDHYILDVEFSQEPIAMVLPEDDSQWNNIVKWVINATIEAEELGLNSDNIEQFLAVNTDDNPNNNSEPAIRRFLGVEGELGEALGLPDDFAYNIVKLVGNYGEIYDRHFPDLERDRNLLYSDGGLLYSPPFSGSFDEDSVTFVDNDNRDLVQEIKDRGELIVRIGGTSLGFSYPNQSSTGILPVGEEYVGFDVDLGKAIATAVFNDSSKVKFVTREDGVDWLTSAANGEVDLTIAQVTQNLVRDGKAGIDFTAPYLYTGQGFLVKKDSGILNLATLNGHKVGLIEGTTAGDNLQDAMREYGGTFIPVYYDNLDEMLTGYSQGDIDAIINDLPLLSGIIPTLSNPDEHRLLDDVISKEPLSMLVDENQSEWADIVNWVMTALVQAEEDGITSENIDQVLAENAENNGTKTKLRQFLGLEGNIGESLGLSNDFVVNVIKAVGNYGEIYNRHFDTDVLRRDLNELASDFGLQYALPFTSTGNPTEVTASFDIDGDGQYSANVDGLLFYGYLNIRNLPSSLVTNLTQQLADNLIAPDSGAIRTTGEDILNYLESNQQMMDIDGNGEIQANVDGLLAYGYLNIHGIGVPDLVNNLTQQLANNLISDDNAIRTTGIEIYDFMNQYMGI